MSESKYRNVEENNDYQSGSRDGLLPLPAELQTPPEAEEVDELSNTQQTEASAETNQASKCSHKILNSVDDVLVVLDNALVTEVHM